MTARITYAHDDLWGRLSLRMCGLRRDLVKQWAYVLLYGGSIDPWVDHLLSAEIDALVEEWGQTRAIEELRRG